MTRPAEKKKRWTVMVYLAGDNNLDAAGAADLVEMKRVGSTEQVALVAQFDRSGAKRVTNRYVLRKGTALADDVVTALGETDTGDPAVLPRIRDDAICFDLRTIAAHENNGLVAASLAASEVLSEAT